MNSGRSLELLRANEPGTGFCAPPPNLRVPGAAAQSALHIEPKAITLANSEACKSDSDNAPELAQLMR
jgi:hypothetical protein